MNEMSKKRKINLALIGAGKWAVDYHLPTICSDDLKNKLNLCGIWNRTQIISRACLLFYKIYSKDIVTSATRASSKAKGNSLREKAKGMHKKGIHE